MSCRLPHLTLAPLLSRLRRQNGQALVEFAIVLPVLLLLILGILYFGRYESYSSQMTQLSEEGARDAAVDFTFPTTGSCTGTNATLACYIASQATGELASGNGSTVAALSVTVDCNAGVSGNTAPCTAGDNVTVCMQSRVLFPGLNGVSGGTVEQQATTRIEQTSPTASTAGSGYSNLVSDSTYGSNAPSC